VLLINSVLTTSQLSNETSEVSTPSADKSVDYEQVQAGSEITMPEDAAEISIINPHSSPKAGDNWAVSFETTGTADLTITPDEVSINDLRE
jgi:hypothetical protein